MKKCKTLEEFRKDYKKSQPWYVNLYWRIRLTYLKYKYRFQDYIKK